MARWNNLDDTELDARTIYVGSYGFRDNDAYNHIWGRTAKAFERAMRSAICDTARTNACPWDGGPSYSENIDTIWYVGPFAASVGEMVLNLEERDRANEMRDNIRISASGYVF